VTVAPRPDLVAAYRDGLGVVLIALVCGAGPDEGWIVAGAFETADTARVSHRWWCRNAADAERVAATANRRLRRLDPQDRAARAEDITARTARRLQIALRPDAEVAAEAATVIARIDNEMNRMQRAGDLRSVNQSYRTYRLETAARGDRVMPYALWLRKYQESLVRKAASMLRYL
jgi:hypothetical protein